MDGGTPEQTAFRGEARALRAVGLGPQVAGPGAARGRGRSRSAAGPPLSPPRSRNRLPCELSQRKRRRRLPAARRASCSRFRAPQGQAAIPCSHAPPPQPAHCLRPRRAV